MSRKNQQRPQGPKASDRAEESPEGDPSFGQKAWEQVSTLGLAILIAFAIRLFVIEPFRIPSESMLPTLLVGDHLFVNKFLYGAQIPFTNGRFPGIREPERGDVVVFQVARSGERILPADKHPDLPREDFVKRIVGLPGDRVEVDEQGVFVNGKRVAAQGTGEIFVDERGNKLDVQVEDLSECRHEILHDPRQRGITRDSFVIPEDRYFMVGDNRDHSNDSRNWGTVHFDQFKGPAFILYWSWDVNGNFLEFFNPVNWFTADKRWSRVFQRVRCEEVDPTTLASSPASGSR